jgi:radical SAM/Cys-rich protein
VSDERPPADPGPPRATRTLRAQGDPLAAPATQRAQLEALPHPPFADALRAARGAAELDVASLEILQLNLGKLCNMTCRHCHVDAGPDRVEENASRATLEAALDLLDRSTAHTVDLTGGAPELHPDFRWLVQACAARGKHVIDRCNLTVLTLPRSADLPNFFAEHGVEVVCSLPHWRRPNTDRQRGDGTYDRSIQALRLLNAAGYGQGDPRRRLTLMHNPAGAFLPSGIPAMEREWRAGLAREHGVQFDRLIALNNMPIARFLQSLVASGNLAAYQSTLVAAFNPAAVSGLMCRNTLSVGWDGQLYDCDFNQMLAMPCAVPGHAADLRGWDPHAWAARHVVTGAHCYGCTAGAGSSCGGATT